MLLTHSLGRKSDLDKRTNFFNLHRQGARTIVSHCGSILWAGFDLDIQVRAIREHVLRVVADGDCSRRQRFECSGPLFSRRISRFVVKRDGDGAAWRENVENRCPSI